MAQTVSWAIQKAYLHANRKATPPNAGSTKHDALLAIADSMQKMWPAEHDWASLYSLAEVGTVTATDTFELDDEIDHLNRDADDPVRITLGTQTKTYKLVSPAQLYKYRNSDVCAQVGRNLVFPQAFDSTSSVFGGTIYAPATLAVEDITSENQDVQVDRPMWLAYMMAAEFARNDTVKQGQYENLLAMAESELTKMIEDNDGTVNEYALNGFQAAGEDWV